MPDIIEIEVSDAGDIVLLEIFELGGAGSQVYLDDLKLVTDRGLLPEDPVEGVNEVNLPAAWNGKRLRVFRNKGLFTNYTRTANGIALLGEDILETEEELIFSNY